MNFMKNRMTKWSGAHARVASLVVVVAFASNPTAQAIDIVTIPADLNPGDEYRLVFVSDGTHDAVSGDIAVYDTFVGAEAMAVPEIAALGATWSAIASTDAVDARDHTGTNPAVNGAGVPIYGLDGLRVADNNGDLWDGALANTGIYVTPSGISLLVDLAWTGTGAGGTAASLVDSSDTPLGGESPGIGATGATNIAWSDFVNRFHFFQSDLWRIYAISTRLVVPESKSPTLAQWQTLFGISDLDGDSDDDGSHEILEYGLLMDPSTSDAPEVSQALTDIDGELFLDVTYLRHRCGQPGSEAEDFDYAYGGVFYRVEVSTSLAPTDWQWGNDVTQEVVVEPLTDSTVERVTVRINEPATGQRYFTRVTVGVGILQVPE